MLGALEPASVEPSWASATGIASTAQRAIASGATTPALRGPSRAGRRLGPGGEHLARDIPAATVDPAGRDPRPPRGAGATGRRSRSSGSRSGREAGAGGPRRAGCTTPYVTSSLARRSWSRRSRATGPKARRPRPRVPQQAGHRAARLDVARAAGREILRQGRLRVLGEPEGGEAVPDQRADAALEAPDGLEEADGGQREAFDLPGEIDRRPGGADPRHRRVAPDRDRHGHDPRVVGPDLLPAVRAEPGREAMAAPEGLVRAAAAQLGCGVVLSPARRVGQPLRPPAGRAAVALLHLPLVRGGGERAVEPPHRTQTRSAAGSNAAELNSPSRNAVGDAAEGRSTGMGRTARRSRWTPNATAPLARIPAPTGPATTSSPPAAVVPAAEEAQSAVPRRRSPSR